jgi:hypothetical protein
MRSSLQSIVFFVSSVSGGGLYTLTGLYSLADPLDFIVPMGRFIFPFIPSLHCKWLSPEDMRLQSLLVKGHFFNETA